MRSVGDDDRTSAPVAEPGNIEYLQQRVGQLEELLAVRSRANPLANTTFLQNAL